MSIEEWIGSLISMLALAALFFLNQRKEKRAETQKRDDWLEDSKDEGEDEEDEEDVWSHLLKAAPVLQKTEQIVKKVAKPLPKPVKGVRAPVIPFDEEFHDLQVKRTELQSSGVIKLKRLPSVHGELSERCPRVKRIIGSLPSLRTMIICREILDKPKC